jgi:hypothetical protein
MVLYFAAISTANVQDVRDVLNYYRQFDNPLEMFKENRRKLLVSYRMHKIRDVKQDHFNLMMIIDRCKWRKSKTRHKKRAAKYLPQNGNRPFYGIAKYSESFSFEIQHAYISRACNI